MRMQNLKIKSLVHKPKVSVITLDRNDGLQHLKISEKAQNYELEDLAVLLGAYNEYGSSMDVDKFHNLQDKFESIIDEVNALIHQTKEK